MKSPCVKLCTVSNGHCEGCARSLDEIARWASMSEAEREAIMRLLPQRARALGFPPAPAPSE